jgi:CBS domain containing-hemolysin-like protein
MNDTEPPSRSGHNDEPGAAVPHVAPSRLRHVFRFFRRPRVRTKPIDAMVAAAEAEAGIPIAPQERVLLGNILKVHGRTAVDVMVPRGDIVAIDGEAPFPDLVKSLVEHGHSRLPVYRETLDDVIGYVHVKDVLAPVAGRRPAKLSGLLRKVLFVAPSLPILDLLLQMRQARTHIAMVVDEFGGIDGLVTIEDLIEEIIGEIEDEHDVAVAPTLSARPDGSVIADARIPIEAIELQHGTRLRAAEDQEDIDTLGGLVFALAGRVPKRGEIIPHPGGIEFEVLDADPNRIKRLRVRGLPAIAGRAAGDA